MTPMPPTPPTPGVVPGKPTPVVAPAPVWIITFANRCVLRRDIRLLQLLLRGLCLATPHWATAGWGSEPHHPAKTSSDEGDEVRRRG